MRRRCRRRRSALSRRPHPAYGIGTAFAGSLTTNGETSVLTDIVKRKIGLDGGPFGACEHQAASSEPGGAGESVTCAPRDSKTRNRADWMANGEILGESKPDTARFARPLQAGNAWRPLPRWEDRVVHPERSGEDGDDFEVPAYEKATMPAGRYLAFKVGATRTRNHGWHEVSWNSQPGRGRRRGRLGPREGQRLRGAAAQPGTGRRRVQVGARIPARRRGRPDPRTVPESSASRLPAMPRGGRGPGRAGLR